MKKIIVIKLGSSILMTKRGKLDKFRIAHIADQVASLQLEGFGVVLVVSGAVACGHKFAQFSKQAAAGIGQSILTSVFTKIFSKKEMHIAQVLVTKNTFFSLIARQNLKELLTFYAQSGFVAMVNENDVLDLNSFGGNDLLAAEIAALLVTEKMMILSTMAGSVHGVGGGTTKKQAIEILAEENIKATILDGKRKNILLTS